MRGWPQSADYNEAIQNLPTSVGDDELRAGSAELDKLGRPMPYAGNFADVYRVDCPDTGNSWAVKCFTREVSDLRDRYRAISEHLERVRLPFMTDFRYIEEGVRVNGYWYPIVKMRWVEGVGLNRFVGEHFDQPKLLGQLGELWIRMAERLEQAKLAHADLQHGNVLLVPVTETKSLRLTLIDYDGMHVPALAKRGSGERGHPAFQHPQRLRDGTHDATVDRFSHLAIYTALQCLAADPTLWAKYDTRENLLFRQADFAVPRESDLFRRLWESQPAPRLRVLVGRLVLATQEPLDRTPRLSDFIRNGRPASLSADDERRAAMVLGIATNSMAIIHDVASHENVKAQLLRQAVEVPARASADLATASSPPSDPKQSTSTTQPTSRRANLDLIFVAIATVAITALVGAYAHNSGIASKQAEAAAQAEADKRQAEETRQAELQHVAKQADASRLRAVEVQRLAGAALVTTVRPAAFERGRLRMAQADREFQGRRFNIAIQEYDQAVAEFDAARTEAQTANRLGQLMFDWTKALAAVDESRLTKHSPQEFAAAKEQAAKAKEAAAADQLVVAATGYQTAMQMLAAASSQAAKKESDIKANIQAIDTFFQALDTAISAGDVTTASGLLVKAEASFSEDPRLAKLRLQFQRLLPATVTNSLKMKFVLIPSGEFLMGSPDDEPGAFYWEKPQHLVRITKPFYLGVTEVTQGHWQAVMGTVPWHDHSVFRKEGPNHAAYNISWHDADDFCRRLIAMEQRIYRLPTEAEWEYACRAGTTTKYHFGDDASKLSEYAWWGADLDKGNAEKEKYAHPVGLKRPNAWGLYDMSGNVTEWCTDWWDGDFYRQSRVEDPNGFTSGELRAGRGGSWRDSRSDLRSAHRGPDTPKDRHYYHGFRVVLSP